MVVPTGFQVLRIVLGLLLLSAAAFKAHALWFDPNPPFSLFASPRWQIAVIELEAILGLWLVTGVYLWGAWLAALSTFGLLSGASLYLAAGGLPSCGCFGKLAIPPWYTFSFDVVAVAALWYWRPQPTSLRSLVSLFSPSRVRPALRLSLGVTALLGVCFAALALIGPSPSSGLALLRDESVTVEPEVSDIGTGVRGEVRQFHIQVRNQTDRPIRIVGGTANCFCAPDDLPIILPPQEGRTISLQANFTGRPRVFQ